MHSRSLRASAALLLLGLLAPDTTSSARPPASQGKVWIVDDAPWGADFATILPAIEAAADGDTILVREGVYAPPAIDVSGKSLTITAAEGAEVIVRASGSVYPTTPYLRVRNLSASQQVVVRGIEFHVEYGDLLPYVSGCDGPVRLERCVVRTGSQPLLLESSSSVVLSDCEIAPVDCDCPNVAAVLCKDVTASFFDTRLVGLDMLTPGGIGGWGLEAYDSDLTLTRCEVLGGDAGEAVLTDEGTCLTLDGGDAVRATNSRLVVRDSLVAGGAAAWGRPCPESEPGRAWVLDAASTLEIDPAPAPAIAVDPWRRENAVLQVRLDAPGRLAFVLLSTEAQTASVPPLGQLLVVDPLVLRHPDVLPGAGATLDVPVGGLPLGVEAATWHVQGAFLDPATGAIELANAASVTVLDAKL